jgi:hypothetical protein
MQTGNGIVSGAMILFLLFEFIKRPAKNPKYLAIKPKYGFWAIMNQAGVKLML